jgi:PAS domain S-box-containing protein
MATSDANTGRSTRRTLFILVAVVLLLSIAWTYLMGNAVVSSNQEIVREQAVISHLTEVLSTVKDAETGQRGYLLSGEPSYLAPYHSALAHIHDELASLDTLTKSEDLLAADVDRLKRLVELKLTELQQTLDLHDRQGFEAAVAMVRTNVGRHTMEQLRSLAAVMAAEENGELAWLRKRADRLTRERSLVFAIATAVNLSLLALAFKRISREEEKREQIADEVRQQKELLAVTLGSIGDGVIVTDPEARITFMNEVAEKLSGWDSAEAIGQPCVKVFNIINESTRTLVESPVEKVLRLGTIVGLANHTLLIRKDKTELPIDDSGAPVRDREGKIRGVVLVFRDFTDHKQAEQLLVEAKEAAEEANIAKDNFLATLSHELRTPLTPVLATLGSWETSDEVPAALLPEVQMLRRNVDLEARLIDDLLDLTRIVRGKLSLNPEVADVHELVRSVAGMYQSEINTKRLQLSMQLEASEHYVYADPARLQQVFWNILKNATKFTRQGGKIELATANDSQGQVRVIFKDDGIGIDQALLSKLFLPFEQGTDETVRRYGGLGLGLAISKALMDAQGGSIAADSAGPGKGSEFTVGLPCVNAPKSQDAIVSSTESSQSALTILLVEDHVDTARVMSRLLRAGGHTVIVADSVASAVVSASANRIEMIISDIGLPDGTGIDLIRTIRQTSQTPAIALTGFGMEEDVAKCVEAGFNDHLTKPVNLQKLEMAIRQLSVRRSV